MSQNKKKTKEDNKSKKLDNNKYQEKLKINSSFDDVLGMLEVDIKHKK